MIKVVKNEPFRLTLDDSRSHPVDCQSNGAHSERIFSSSSATVENDYYPIDSVITKPNLYLKLNGEGSMKSLRPTMSSWEKRRIFSRSGVFPRGLRTAILH